MAISTVSICNRALDLLGADPITSLEDGSKAANLCQRNFEPSADSVLRLYPWNAALRRARLPALSETPAWGYLYQYQLPQGPEPAFCLRLLEIDNGSDYRVEGRRILADYAAPLDILYIGRVTDTATFDPLLAEAVAAKLAVHLAGNLTESGSRIEAARNYLREILAQAKAIDAQEGGAASLVVDAWLQARG
ncbi:MAG: hypothetical protein J0626_09000 [Rhodospirillaceae bacterium]|nr:hypothetical protein [Rhodospirillaceae bacterium]